MSHVLILTSTSPPTRTPDPPILYFSFLNKPTLLFVGMSRCLSLNQGSVLRR